MSQKHENGGELIKLGGVTSIGPIWAHLEDSGHFVASGGSNPARLGELGGHHLPHFAIKCHRGAERKGSSTLGKHISLKISEKKEKEEENQGRGSSITLP